MSTAQNTKPKLHITDQRMLELIDLLLKTGKIEYQKDFCHAIKIGVVNVSGIRRGERRFTIDQVEKACEKYKVSADWVFGYSEEVFRQKQH